MTLTNHQRINKWKKFKCFDKEGDAKRQSNRLGIICNYTTRVEYDPADKKYWLYILEGIESRQINKTLTDELSF